MDDLFEDSDENFYIDPKDLEKSFQTIMTLQLAKGLVEKGYGSWTKETEYQEAMSALLASCYGRGLKNILITVTRKSGQKITRELDVEKIAKSRRLS